MQNTPNQEELNKSESIKETGKYGPELFLLNMIKTTTIVTASYFATRLAVKTYKSLMM